MARQKKRCATDRDSIFERALGTYKIPLDDRIRRLELTELGIVGLAKQILRDHRQGLRVRVEDPRGGGVIPFSSLAKW